MSHIFGIAHTLGGILDQVGGFFGPGNASGTYPGFGGSGFVAPPGGPIDEDFGGAANDFGGGNGGSPYIANVNSGRCAPTPKIKRYVTTVCPDGSVYTREAKSRKRRRRLASLSDIKDIAALKQVFGGGKAFETWIATRGR